MREKIPSLDPTTSESPFHIPASIDAEPQPSRFQASCCLHLLLLKKYCVLRRMRVDPAEGMNEEERYCVCTRRKDSPTPMGWFTYYYHHCRDSKSEGRNSHQQQQRQDSEDKSEDAECPGTGLAMWNMAASTSARYTFGRIRVSEQRTPAWMKPSLHQPPTNNSS